MDIKNEIQRYIRVYSGSEDRVIENVMSECRCDEEGVKANIDWLEKYKYIKYVPFLEMNAEEKRYYQSDNCTILRNIKSYDEKEHLKIKQKEYEEINKFPTKDKFNKYFFKMEEEFDRKELYNGKTYTIKYSTNSVSITLEDDNNRTILIDFDKITDLYFNEPENSIYYKENNKTYVIELYYLWGKCCLKHYIAF